MTFGFRHDNCAKTLEYQVFRTNSCHDDRGTQWVSAELIPSASISTARSSWSSTARLSPVTPDSSPIANSMTPCTDHRQRPARFPHRVPPENVIHTRFLDVFIRRPTIALPSVRLSSKANPTSRYHADRLAHRPDQKRRTSSQRRIPTPDFAISQIGDREPTPIPDTPVPPEYPGAGSTGS